MGCGRFGNLIGTGPFITDGCLDLETGQGVESVRWHTGVGGAEAEIAADHARSGQHRLRGGRRPHHRPARHRGEGPTGPHEQANYPDTPELALAAKETGR